MIDFYYGSGSPYAWRVWLALEHKQLPYRFHLLSFQNGEHKKPEFLAINPRHQVPAIVDDGFALYESNAICEYLDEAYPDRPLLPKSPKERAIVRRHVLEADHHVYAGSQLLARQLWFTPEAQWDGKVIEEGRQRFVDELALLETRLTGDWIAGAGPSAADYAYYPFFAAFPRYEKKKADLGLSKAIGPKVGAWMKRVESLPYFGKTYPPHWKQS